MKLHPLAIAVNLGNRQMAVVGHKGGESKPQAPVEAPDSLASIATAKILDLISEGEIEGLVNGLRSVYLDETPVANEDGSLNHTGVVLDYRSGTQTQEYIKGYPSVESEVAVGVALKASQPYTKTFSNNQLSAVRIRLSTPRLTQTSQGNGNTYGYRVEYVINLRTGNGPYVEYLRSAFDGKTTKTYERSHRIDLPTSGAGWTIQVVRLTPDSTTDSISSTTNIVSTTEMIDAKFKYPNSALIGLQFDASQFQSIPPRAYYIRGIRIKVPNNYDPASRVYTGVWDGSFKVVYSDNPAWIYYDLVLSDRYGLGHMIKPYQMDRYELYKVAQYCDQMVSDGKGGMEPRFSCCLYLQKRADALKVIQDLASIFRGMTYWGNAQAVVSCDMPSDPVYTYTTGNVIDGKFERSSTGAKDRYSVALVSWNDMSDFGRAKVEYVEDRDSLALFGHRQTELAGIGCKSQGQAQRMGRWALVTNKLETDTLSFSVALDGTLVRPGAIVRIADNKRAGRRIGGRLRASTLTQLTLDGQVTVKAGDSIHVIRADTGQSVSTPVLATRVENGYQVVTTGALPALPSPQGVWAVDSLDLATEQFRILSISEDFTGKNMMFKVTATKHVPGKFANIDNGTRIESRPVTTIPPSFQAPTKNVLLTSDYAIDQGNVHTTMSITWDAVDNAVAYEVQWKVNNGSWVNAGRTGTTLMEVQGILPGRYQARVQAFNTVGLGSIWANSIEYRLESRNVPPPPLSYLRTEELVFGIEIDWGYPEGIDVTISQRVELWYSPTADITTAVKQGEYSYPTDKTSIMGLQGGVQFFFWARLVDKIGNYGPFTGPVRGMSEDDPGIILEYLKGQITETELAKDLLDKINTPVDVSGLQDQIDQIEADLGNLVDALEYVPTKAYVKNNAVRVGNNLWTAKIAVPAKADGTNGPPNATYWINSGTVTNEFGATVAQVSQNTQNITVVDNKVTAQSNRLDGVVTALDGKASANALSSLDTKVTQQGDRIDATATKLDGVYVQVNPDYAGSTVLMAGSAQVYVGVYSVQTAIVEGDTAIGQRLDTVDITVDNINANVTSLSKATVDLTGRLDSEATRIDQVSVKVDGVSGDVGGVKNDLSGVKTDVGGVKNDLSGVKSDLRAVEANVSTVSTATANLAGQVSASYQIKTSVTSGGRTYISGIGVGVVNNQGIVESQVLVAASRFAVMDPNGSSLIVPFVIQGGQVILDQALIGKATIQNLLVGNVFTSVAVNSSGQPLMVMNLQTGQFTLRATSGQGRTEQTNQAFLVYDTNNVLRTRNGIW